MNQIPIVSSPMALMRVIGRATDDLFEIAVPQELALRCAILELATDLNHLVSRETAQRWQLFDAPHVRVVLHREQRSYRGAQIYLVELTFVHVPPALVHAFKRPALYQPANGVTR